jgi:hypothetical protein
MKKKEKSSPKKSSKEKINWGQIKTVNLASAKLLQVAAGISIF